MSVDAATVKRIAHLARLKLPEEKVEPMMNELNAILGFVEQLAQVDTDGVEAMTSVIPVAARWREDEVTDGAMPEKVLKNAPLAEFGFFAVPKVIE